MNAMTTKPVFEPASKALSDPRGGPERPIVPPEAAPRRPAAQNAADMADAASLSRFAGRMMITHAVAAVICIFIDRIYALFAHGVASAAMSGMFLYPLLGGAMPFMLLWLKLPQWGRQTAADRAMTKDSRRTGGRRWRIFTNAWNSGIATLTIGSMVRGMLEIAGTDSSYLIAYAVAGNGLLAIGSVSLLLLLVHRRVT